MFKKLSSLMTAAAVIVGSYTTTPVCADSRANLDQFIQDARACVAKLAQKPDKLPADKMDDDIVSASSNNVACAYRPSLFARTAGQCSISDEQYLPVITITEIRNVIVKINGRNGDELSFNADSTGSIHAVERSVPGRPPDELTDALPGQYRPSDMNVAQTLIKSALELPCP